LWDQGWRGTGPKKARKRKIPDTWTLEIHAIVLKDSRQAEHEEIGDTSTTRQRNARNKKDTTRRSSEYSNIKRGGRGAQKARNARNQRHDKTKLSVLEHQTWWERSSKERNARKQQDTTRRSSVYSNTKRGGRRAQNEKKRSKQKDMTKRSSVYSNIKRGGRGAQNKKKETLETKRHDKTKLSVLKHQTWWERSSKTQRRRCPEERKIKRLNHHGQTASTYRSLPRPERN